MEHAIQSNKPRIEVVDALRGFAVMAIILLHNIEHFNLYYTPEAPNEWVKALDSGVWDTLFFLFGGKAYAIFALLFGFSFFIQDNNQAQRGQDFRLRFLWRLTLLFCIGCFNAAFFPGEILVLYAILGVTLIPVCRLSDRTVLAIAIFLMLQPMEWGKWLYAVCHPDYVATPELWTRHSDRMYPILMADDFWATLRSNIWDGQLFSHLWAWSNGRFFQTSSLFMLGMLLGRRGMFSRLESHRRFWSRALLIAIICFIPLYLLADALPGLTSRPEELKPLRIIVSSLRNFSFMTILVSSFVLLWQCDTPRRMLRGLAPYGKMSLTNYLTQSIVGSFIYFGYGLGMYAYLGATACLGVGILLFILQLSFCHWWLRHHRQGPFEWLWRKGTWIGAIRP